MGDSRRPDLCREVGATFTGLLCQALSSRLDGETETGRRTLGWNGRSAFFDALPLRLTGGLHAIRRADAELLHWLDGPPQTNETARAALLMAGLLEVTKEFALPIRMYEISASAGLNLLVDRYSYRLGTLSTGTFGSSVHLTPAWVGQSPPAEAVVILDREGADLAPVHVQNAAERERMTTYVWPEHSDRLERMQKAFDLAFEHPPPISRAEAADWIEATIAPAPHRGCVRVLWHSIAFQYFPEETKSRIVAHVQRIGAMATADGPFAWLQFEADAGTSTRPELRLQAWPGGKARVLAESDNLASQIRWLGRP